jgi:hypothetical protein
MLVIAVEIDFIKTGANFYLGEALLASRFFKEITAILLKFSIVWFGDKDRGN